MSTSTSNRSKRRIIQRNLSIVESQFVDTTNNQDPSDSQINISAENNSKKPKRIKIKTISKKNTSKNTVNVVTRASQLIELLQENGDLKESRSSESDTNSDSDTKINSNLGSEMESDDDKTPTTVTELTKKNKNYAGIIKDKKESKKKRNALTLKQKIEVLHEMEKGVRSEELINQFQCGLTQIKTIKRNKQELLALAANSNISTDTVRLRDAEMPTIEKALARWIRGIRSTPPYVPINDQIVQMKAQDFRSELLNLLNQRLQSETKVQEFKRKLIEFKFSNGWCQKFKSRHGFKFNLEHGEAGDVDMKVVDQSRIDFQNLLKQYLLADIYNCDETALFYKLLPNQSLSVNSKQSGHKRSKERVTVLLCCNADGSDKRKLLVIGKAENPRPLSKLNKNNLPCVYTNQRKAWMNSTIFFEYLWELNAAMEKENRNIVLIIDGAGCHGSKQDYENEHRLSNINLIFLPPNCTAKMQPLDQGIIRSFKAHYRRKIIRKYIHSYDSNLGIPTINIYDAVHFSGSSWNNHVTSETIKNCWRKSGILPPEHKETLNKTAISDSNITNTDMVSVQQELLLFLSRNEFKDSDLEPVAQASAFIDCDLNEPTEEESFNLQEECLNILYDEHVIQTEDSGSIVAVADFEENETPKPITTKQFLTAVQTVIQFFEQKTEDKTNVIRLLNHEVTKEERNQLSQLMQTSIKSFFAPETTSNFPTNESSDEIEILTTL